MVGYKDEYLYPVWEGGKLYRETFAMVEEGGSCEAAFLYEPEKILRIESYDGLHVYEPGRDCIVKDGKLVLTPDSRIPHTDWNTFYYLSEEEAKRELSKRKEKLGFGPVSTTDGRFLNLSAIGNPDYVTRWQIAVTYTTQERWVGKHPVSEVDHLPDFWYKVKRKKNIRIVLFGDSISCGCDCSGLYHKSPYQPLWPDLLAESLRNYYDVAIELINTSEGGRDTEWAIQNIGERVANWQPDLVLLGFGMNDRCSGTEYGEKTRQMVNDVLSACPGAEIVLMATSLPNHLTKTSPFYFCSHQDEHGDALLKLCRMGVVLADMQGVQKELMKRKRYIDITGNLLNHPNDYLARIQAQVLRTILIPS